MYKHILLASDGSSHAERAGKEAIKIASINEGKVTLVYVNSASSGKGKLDERVAAVQQKLQMTENDLKAAQVDYQIEVLDGEPGPSIIKYANESAFDIVVIGSRGLNDFQGMVLGSVSHKVAKHSNCPVLIIK